jgi:hypothetical protein
MDLKRQEQAQDWFDKNSKLQWKEVDYSIQKPLADLLQKTYAGMVGAQRKSGGRLTPDLQDTVTDLKMKYDNAQQMASSFSNEIKQADEILKADKYGRYNKGYVAQQMLRNSENAWTTDEIGLPTWNADAKSPLEILKDPKAISLQGLVSEYLDNIETVEQTEVQDMGAYTQSNAYKFKPLYETDKQGLPIKDPNTGKYIPKASPESIYLWDQDSDRKTQLDTLAADNGLSRSDAFKKFIVQPFASVNKKTAGGRDYKPEYIVNPKGKEDQADLVYPIIESIVENKSDDALQQLSVGNENFRFKWGGGDLKTFDGGFDNFQYRGKTPDKSYIVVEQLQPAQTGFNPVTGQYTAGKKEWVEYDKIYLDDKDEAFSVLSQYFDATNDTKLSQQLFDKRKKKSEAQPKSTKGESGITWK